MHIKADDTHRYLNTKSIAYNLGWEKCLGGEDALTSRRELHTSKQREEFDQGYGDCYAYGESELTEFNYEEGI